MGDGGWRMEVEVEDGVVDGAAVWTVGRPCK